MWSTDPAVRRALALGVALVSAALGCVEHAIMERVHPTEYALPTPVPPPEPTDGAIWRGGTASGSFLYFDRKARGVGDLVTVMIVESVSAEGSANTATDSTSTISADLTSDIGFTQLLQKGAEAFFGIFGIDDAGGTAAPGETVNAVRSSIGNGYEGDGETSRSSSFSAIVTCRVVEVLPGGLFHVLGRRQIVVNHEMQLITIEGLVRREDISIHNTVASTALADARLTYDGIGVLDDKQRPSLLGRFIDWVFPF